MMAIINPALTPVKSHKFSPLPSQWSQFLSPFPWNWWATFTFRDLTHPEAAGKVFDHMVHQLNKEIFGNRYYKKKNIGVIWARGTEYQKRSAIHYHALLGNIPDRVRRMDYVDLWFTMAGIARIFDYVPGLGAEHYMSKSSYAWKRGEIDLGGPLAAFNQSAGLFC